MSRKLEAIGGPNGVAFDDGVNEHVIQVFIGEDSQGIVYVKIYYVKDGEVVIQQHGRNRGKPIRESRFTLEYPDEYITLIEGSTREFKNNEFVSSLQFTTSHARRQLFGRININKPIIFQLPSGAKIVGFHGRSGDVIDAIGLHVVFLSSAFKKMEPYGECEEGFRWDDGAYDGLRKVCVEEDGNCLRSIRFEYLKGNKLITHSHGKKPQNETKLFLLNDDEYVTSVEGTYLNNNDFRPLFNAVISSLTFKTSQRRSSEVFGEQVGTKFVLEANGFDKLVGFRGYSTKDCINAIGANFAVVLPPSVKKLEAKGGNNGDEWDDGVHDKVSKIIVRYSKSSVDSVKFEYLNGTKTVFSDAHGNSIMSSTESQLVLLEDEYITSVEVLYGQIKPIFSNTPHKNNTNIIRILKFKTNKGTYEVLGNNRTEFVGTSFVLEENDHKIVGFYGKSLTAPDQTASHLDQIGVYVKPIN